MANDVIEQAKSAIRERLSELDDEKKRLERALLSLSGEVRRPGRPRGSSNGAPSPGASRKRGARRAKRGQREKQLLRSIKSNPSYKPAEHAHVIGIAPSQIYGLVAKMTEAGKIRKGESGVLEAA